MKGIVCAGHWVLDHIKFVDHWPNLSELSNISIEFITNGGAPFNILVDLANLKVDFPCYGIGCVGDDPASQHVLRICAEKNINTEFLRIMPGETTSYTDVMTMEENGMRTMFHYRGVNRKFIRQYVPIEELKRRDPKLFYLGHLLLMDGLEKPSVKYGISAAHLLHDIKTKTNMDTVVDIATESSQRYDAIVLPCLPYTDHFIINELETQKITKIPVRKKNGELILKDLKEGARIILDHGVRKNVVIHMPEGAYWLTKERKGLWYPSLEIPNTFFKAACGAGDAFCAGSMVGLHKEWSIEETLKLATATAAAAIHSSSNSDGIKPIKKTLQLADRFPLRGELVYDNNK